jgi:hypothetical protein
MEAPTNPLARSLALAVVAGVCCALAVAAPAHAGETLVVDDDRKDCPDAETTSIQAAVDNASEGDRVEVCPGNYPESITVDTDAVELVGDRATVVDPGGAEATLKQNGTLAVRIPKTEGAAGTTVTDESVTTDAVETDEDEDSDETDDESDTETAEGEAGGDETDDS